MPSVPEAMFDLRVVERHIHEGRVTQAEYDTFLSGLEDSASNVETSSVSLVTHVRSRVVQADVAEDEEG